MKKSIFQIIGLLLLLPLFSGCNDSDDVARHIYRKDLEAKLYHC